MGAETFTVESEGKTAQEAFTAAVSKAQYDHGHSGYTGTIAEKTSFVPMGKVQFLEDAKAKAEKFIEDRDKRIDDKWGPAGCIEIVFPDKGKYLFFGWASS